MGLNPACVRRFLSRCCRLLPVGLLAVATVAQAQEVITVFGSQTVFQHAGLPTDTPNLIRLAPGGAVNRNGALTSIPQYRGQYTYRIQTHLDGRQPHTAGPVWMDSPLHYMPSSMIESLEVQRGIAPVRVGPALGGYIKAESYVNDYGLGEGFEFHGRLSADNFSHNDGNSASVFLGMANDASRYFVFGVRDEGDDTRSADRTIASSEYERDFFGFGLGRRWADGEWSFRYARNNTGEAGTPALPMDIDFYHTDMLNMRGRLNAGGWDLEAQVHYQHTDHEMSNYHMRPPPDFSQANLLPPFRGDDRRHARVGGESFGAKLHGSQDYAGGLLRLGADMRWSEHNALVTDPDAPPFFVENFKNATVGEYGVFAEWDGALRDAWRMELGVRVQHTRTDADAVSHFRPTCQMLKRVNPDHPLYGSIDCATAAMAEWMPAPARSVGMLSGRFNAADRSREDTEVDAVAVFRYDWDEATQLEFGLARKTRVPAYMERYLWVPLETNSGLADGNNYVGDVALEPEVAWQLELGLNWRDGGAMFSPRLFAHRIDDYITGVPSQDADVKRVSGMLNGDATPVRFANVDAEFYGADAVFSIPLMAEWQLDGTVSYVRGRLRESFMSQDGTRMIRDDEAYRLPPLRGVLSVSRQLGNWVVSTEVDWAARQSNLSELLLDDPANAKNHSRAISGYALYNLRAQYLNPASGMKVSVGVENLADRMHADAMNGFNRVSGGDMAVGERLPGVGRSIYAQMAWEW